MMITDNTMKLCTAALLALGWLCGPLCGAGEAPAPEASAASAAEIRPGSGEAGDFSFDCTRDGRSIRVFGYRPAARGELRLLVLFHGANRDARGYRNGARKLAEKLGVLLVVPEFDRERFDSEAYQDGGVMRKGRLVDRAEWTFGWLDALLEQVFQREGRRLDYDLGGHSAGAQHLGRLAALHPTAARRIVLVNPGSLIFPDRCQPYGCGFGGLPQEMSGDEALRRYLAIPLTLYLGTADTGSERLPGGPAAAQGATRIERGRRAFAAAEKLAREKGWPLGWRLVEAEGLGHSAGPMWNHPQCAAAFAE